MHYIMCRFPFPLGRGGSYFRQWLQLAPRTTMPSHLLSEIGPVYHRLDHHTLHNVDARSDGERTSMSSAETWCPGLAPISSAKHHLAVSGLSRERKRRLSAAMKRDGEKTDSFTRREDADSERGRQLRRCSYRTFFSTTPVVFVSSHPTNPAEERFETGPKPRVLREALSPLTWSLSINHTFKSRNNPINGSLLTDRTKSHRADVTHHYQEFKRLFLS